MRARAIPVLVVAVATAVTVTACTTTPKPATPTSPSRTPSAAPSRPSPTPGPPFAADAGARQPDVPAPPTTQDCLEQAKARCYSPAQLARAYDLEPLWREGWTGQGRTIAIVDSFGSPTIRKDLHTFDATFGYPDPKLTIVQPAGKVPAFDRTDSDQTGWAGETTLDVEWAHAMAPGRRHPPGRDTGRRDRGDHRLPRDRQGRDVRPRARPRRRHLAEPGRDRADVQQQGAVAQPAQRLRAGAGRGGQRARRLR